MSDITTLTNAARIVHDEAGEPVVQIPLASWQAWLAQYQPDSSQIERIMLLLQSWTDEPDDPSPQWWNEFREFLEANRLDFEHSDVDLEGE
jgi:hypothetical protein